MAIKDLISPGIGFSPGSVEYIVTRGMDSGEAVIIPGDEVCDCSEVVFAYPESCRQSWLRDRSCGATYNFPDAASHAATRLSEATLAATRPDGNLVTFRRPC